MPDLGELTLASFSERLDERFVIHPQTEAPLDVTLAEATSLGEPVIAGFREPFALLFRGSPERILPQGTYPIENDVLGAFELFMVPLEPDPDGARYEAVFN